MSWQSIRQHLRFSLRDILALLLVAGLILTIVYERRRLAVAENVLEAHGLKWDLEPVSADQFRLAVVMDVSDDAAQGPRDREFSFLAVRIQSPAPGNLLWGVKGDTPIPTALLEGAGGIHSGEVMAAVAQTQSMAPISPQQFYIKDFNRIKGMGSHGGGGGTQSDKPAVYTFKVLAKPGVYPRNVPIPIYEYQGRVYELQVQ
ncbi:MAG: hypothetical protein SGJ19_07850 [Planctomycetia bacterium]|nr:hypothetical protein [Planctomycetia bacterium]